MARSHICPSCLYELGRIRAVPDAHYGLGIVVCPRCSLAAVRTRHPDQQFWRMYHRRRLAIGAALGKTMFTLLMGIVLWGLTEWAVEVFADYRGNIDLMNAYTALDVETALGAWLIPVFLIGIGAITRAIYWHWKAILTGLFILVLGTCIWTLEYTFGTAATWISILFGFDADIRLPSNADMLVRTKLFGMMSLLVLFGLLPGHMLGTMLERSQQKRFRRIRKKLRKRRAYGQ